MLKLGFEFATSDLEASTLATRQAAGTIKVKNGVNIYHVL